MPFSAFRKCHVHTDVVVGVGSFLLCPYHVVSFSTPRAFTKLSSAALTWEDTQDLFLGTCCLQVNLGVLMPEEPEAVRVLGRQVTWGQPSVLRKSPSESHLLYLALHSPASLLAQVCLGPLRSSSLLSILVTSSGFAEFSGIRLF